MSKKISLIAQARHELALATEASSGRSAKTVYGGHECALRQTVIALRAGRRLDEHDNPGEATVQVVQGRIRLHAADQLREGADVVWDGMPGDLIVVPQTRHWVEAIEDAAFVLTVVKGS